MEAKENAGSEIPISVELDTTIKRQKEKFSFSKAVMGIIIVIFITGAILGGVLVIVSAVHDITLGLQIDTGMFIAYAAYLGTPTATAFGFYSWKSRAENILKIQQSAKLSDDMTTLIANVGGE